VSLDTLRLISLGDRRLGKIFLLGAPARGSETGRWPRGAGPDFVVAPVYIAPDGTVLESVD